MMEESGLSGTIVSCDPHSGDLSARLEDGREVCVPFREITRQTNLSREYAARQVGRTLKMLPMHLDGARTLFTIRGYEQARYETIRRGFEEGTRNVYPGRFKQIAPGGKLAFYQLAQGVNGAVHVREFSCSRVDDFNRIELPREMPVVIREMDAQGRIILNTRPAFGTFEDTVSRLNLQPGMVAIGTVCAQFPKTLGVMLSPNVMTMAETEEQVALGGRVRVEIVRMDPQTHKIRSRVIEKVDQPPLRHSDWLIGEMKPWVDLDHFAESVSVRKQLDAAGTETKGLSAQPPSFEGAQEASIFSTREGEEIVPREVKEVSPQQLYRQMRAGSIDGQMIALARAVEALRYATAWQLRRYLYLMGGLNLEEQRLSALLDQLCNLDVTGSLHFDGEAAAVEIYHPSNNYFGLCERKPRNFALRDQREERPERIKSRLAANQLLMGMLFEAQGKAKDADTHPYLFDRPHALRVRPKHIIEMRGAYCVLDAFRAGELRDCAEKLERYANFFQYNPHEDVRLFLVVEDSQLDAFRRTVQQAMLPFPVSLTTDTRCLPAPGFEIVHPARKNLVRQLLDRLIR